MRITLHEGATFVVCAPTGDVTPGTEQGWYHRDTRFASRLQLRLDGLEPTSLGCSVEHEDEAWHFLTNPALDGAPRSTLTVARHRLLGGGLFEELELENFGDRTARFELTVHFGADFAYSLAVKKDVGTGATGGGEATGRARSDGRTVDLLSAGEGPARVTTLAFDPPPDVLDGEQASYRLQLRRRERRTIRLSMTPQLGTDRVQPRLRQPSEAAHRAQTRQQRLADLARRAPALQTDHPVLQLAWERAALDLALLRLEVAPAPGQPPHDDTVAAGVPWYADLFGRDALVAACQSLHHDPSLARGTLAALSRHQGVREDAETEEAPGKIPHECRTGPLPPSARDIIPGYPYYGALDTTPLWLATLAAYARSTGDLDFVREQFDHLQAALDWMQRFGDLDGDGLLEYRRHGSAGPVNHCWKDSPDSMRFHDGAPAPPPLAPVEVQGYAFDALAGAADLMRQLGRHADEEPLRRRASELRARLGHAFRMESRDHFALALDGQKRKVDSLASNPGHLLWSGAVDENDAARIARTLLSDELFAGWGVRTMGSREGGYNPVSSHNGAVWPHDNSLILSGLVRCGRTTEAARLAQGMLAALAAFDDCRFPEMFAGFSSSQYARPVEHPVSNRPQAWSAGAVLLLVDALLGLQVDASRRRIAVRPLALPGLRRLELRGVPAGGARVGVAVVWEEGRPRSYLLDVPRGWRTED